jgi:hypothetical protein
MEFVVRPERANGLLDIIKHQIVSLNFGPHVRTVTASHNKSVKPHEHSTAIARNVWAGPHRTIPPTRNSVCRIMASIAAICATHKYITIVSR